MLWHSKTVLRIASELKSDVSNGITDSDARKRLQKYGENKLEGKKKASLIRRFFAQFADFCVIILFIACIISFLTSLIEGSGDFVEPIVILMIVILNAVIGVFQEQKAEKAIESLKKMSAPTANVIRSGKVKRLPSSQLVPGDLILLESGDMIPADARIIEANSLKVQESSLTGESEPCKKNPDAVFSENCPLAERKNMIFSSTIVISATA
jgi:Ca2+-transporting ATPase